MKNSIKKNITTIDEVDFILIGNKSSRDKFNQLMEESLKKKVKNFINKNEK